MVGGVAGQCATLKPIPKTQSPLTRRSDLLRIVPSLNSEAALDIRAVIASNLRSVILRSAKRVSKDERPRRWPSPFETAQVHAARDDGFRYASAFSRRDPPEVCKNLPPQKRRGRR